MKHDLYGLVDGLHRARFCIDCGTELEDTEFEYCIVCDINQEICNK